MANRTTSVWQGRCCLWLTCKFASVCNWRWRSEARTWWRWLPRWARRWTRRSLYRRRTGCGSPSGWWWCRRRASLRSAARGAGVLRAEVCSDRWRRRRRSRCSLFPFYLSSRRGLILLQIAFDESSMLFYLILRNAHVLQLHQYSLHSRIAQINTRSTSLTGSRRWLSRR